MSTHASHISSHHPSAHTHTSDLLYPPSHKGSTKCISFKSPSTSYPSSAHTSSHHPSTHVSSHHPSSHKTSSHHPSSHKTSTHVSSHHPSSHHTSSVHPSSVHPSSQHPSTHASRTSLHPSSSHNLSVNRSVHPSMYSMQEFGEEDLYEPTPVEDQEILADTCYDNYQLMISVFLKLSKEFEKISDEVDECVKMASKAFEMVDFTQYDDMEQYEDYQEYLDEDEDDYFDEALSGEPRKPSVRFSCKDVFLDPNSEPSCIPLSSNPTLSNYPSTISFSRAHSQPLTISDKSFTTSILTKNPSIAKSIMTAQSFGGNKSVASLNKSIAASILSGKSLAETNRSISRKVLDDNRSVLSNNSQAISFKSIATLANPSIAKSHMSHATLANPSMIGSIGNKSMAKSHMSHATLANPSIAKSHMSHATLANPSIAKSHMSHATLANPSIAKSHMSHATLANPSIARTLSGSMISGTTLKNKSTLGSTTRNSIPRGAYSVEEPMSIYQSRGGSDNTHESISLGKSMMSGIKSLVSRGKSLVLGESGSFGSENRGSRATSLRESKMTMRSHDSQGSKSLFGSKSGGGSQHQSEKPSMMSRIKSLFSGGSTQNNEEEEYVEEEHIEPFAVERRFVELWERIIGKLAVTSNQFKALSELTKSPAVIPNDAFEIPILELPTHADGLPLSADELIHALHNTMIPQKSNQSKVHSLIINVIVAHCEIRNAESFLQQLSEKMAVQPKRLKALSAKRIERSKMIVKQCGDELISTDSRYDNYLNAYYEALERNYPPALGTLEDPPLKHSPTCPYQIESQKLAIYEIRDQYIRERISTFDDLVTGWLLDYTSICQEAGDQLTVQDENLTN